MSISIPAGSGMRSTPRSMKQIIKLTVKHRTMSKEGRSTVDPRIPGHSGSISHPPPVNIT